MNLKAPTTPPPPAVVTSSSSTSSALSPNGSRDRDHRGSDPQRSPAPGIAPTAGSDGEVRPGSVPPGRDVVVLLHGWWANRLVMLRMAWELRRAGYEVINLGYPSVRRPLAQLADNYLPRQLLRRLPRIDSASPRRIHFVTHSMGGLLLRRYLLNHEVSALGRIVQIGPPNQGSALADVDYPSPIQAWGGPNYSLLRTGSEGIAARLPPATTIPGELGVIAGSRALLPARRLARPHDGRVSVAATRLEGMKDHAIVPAPHSWLLWDGRTIALTLRFLRTGSFQVAEARGRR